MFVNNFVSILEKQNDFMVSITIQNFKNRSKRWQQELNGDYDMMHVRNCYYFSINSSTDFQPLT